MSSTSSLNVTPSGWNATSSYEDPITSALFTTTNVLSLILTYGTTCSMGCDVRWNQIKAAFRNPRYLAVGMTCQYLLMPLVGLMSIFVFSLEGYLATGVMVVCCAPGGGYSNLITYLLDGDVCLSVVLTTISRAVAFGVMPLTIQVYRAAGVTEHLTIPFWNMLITLLLLDAALALGLLCRWKLPKGADFITKIGSVFICLVHLLWLILFIYLDPGVLWRAGWKLYAAVFLVSGLGVAIPLVLSKLSGFSYSIGMTLAVETAYQSIGTALTVCFVSFSQMEAHQAQTFAFVYCIVTGSPSTLIGIFYQAFKARPWRNVGKSSGDIIAYTLRVDTETEIDQ